jgi:hypothetical protein
MPNVRDTEALRVMFTLSVALSVSKLASEDMVGEVADVMGAVPTTPGKDIPATMLVSAADPDEA